MNHNTEIAVSGDMRLASESVWRHPWAALVPIAGVYLILGFYRIDDQSLWLDEVISFRRAVSEGPFTEALGSQSPLYFMLLKVWASMVGTGEFALRSLSALIGLATIALVYALGLQLFDRRSAIFAAAILATSPYLVWYAQEVRYITLMLAASTAATWCFYRAVTSGKKSWWMVYSAASSLALLTFLSVIFFLFAHGLFLLYSAPHRRFLVRWIGCQSVVVVLFFAWFGPVWGDEIVAALTQKPAIVAEEQPRTRRVLPVSDVIGTIPYTFFAFSAGFSLGPSLRELHGSRSLESLMSHAGSLAAAALLFGTAAFLGLARLRRDKFRASFLLIWLAVPIVSVFMVATLTSYHVYNTRYVAAALPAYVLILGSGIGVLRRPMLQALLLGALLSVHGVSLANYYFEPRYEREDSRSAARHLEASVRPDDVVVVVGSHLPLEHYYRGGAPILRLDARRGEAEVAAELIDLVDRHPRLWLVKIRPWQTDPQGVIQPLLDRRAHRGRQQNFPGIEIYLYALHDAR